MRRAMFLDRDGTIVREVDFLHRPEEVELIPGAGEAIARVNALGIAVIVVTNQSGIARGMFTADDVAEVHERLDELLSAHGARIDAYYVSPHHPAFTRASECRKPGTGLFRRSLEDLDLTLEGSVMIGDRGSDIGAGRALGIDTVLVRTGYGRDEEARLRGGDAPSHVADSLSDAVAWWLGARARDVRG